jgi:sulfoxide reductase catalytic subunit YedY
MLVKSRKAWELPYSEVTPEPYYRNRRDFLKLAAAGAIGTIAASCSTQSVKAAEDLLGDQGTPTGADLTNYKKGAMVTDPKVDPLNSWDQLTNYNNYYEFGTNKSDPAHYAPKLTTRPWTVKIDGMVAKPGDWNIDDIIKQNALEERIYRHRCVEAWSYVLPWIGFPLSDLIDKVQPTSQAKFVEFTTLTRASEMPFLSSAGISFPYIEGLRMDEARHPLTLMVVGLYGKVLPNQNGAPLRVHIPWKYGFKSGKSIVRIRFTDKQPQNTWAVATPNEYGFYANVNPTVDHPRWSQARERRIPSPFQNRKTEMFNGYGDQVASLYAGMDLRKNF